MTRRRDVGKIRLTSKVVTRSTAHDIAGLLTKYRPQMNADRCNQRSSVAKNDLEREPQFRTDRSTIINSLLRETEVVASKIVVGIHIRDHRLA